LNSRALLTANSVSLWNQAYTFSILNHKDPALTPPPSR